MSVEWLDGIAACQQHFIALRKTEKIVNVRLHWHRREIGRDTINLVCTFNEHCTRPNNEAERRANALTANEAELSTSSTPSLAHRPHHAIPGYSTQPILPCIGVRPIRRDVQSRR